MAYFDARKSKYWKKLFSKDEIDEIIASFVDITDKSEEDWADVRWKDIANTYEREQYFNTFPRIETDKNDDFDGVSRESIKQVEENVGLENLMLVLEYLKISLSLNINAFIDEDNSVNWNSAFNNFITPILLSEKDKDEKILEIDASIEFGGINFNADALEEIRRVLSLYGENYKSTILEHISNFRDDSARILEYLDSIISDPYNIYINYDLNHELMLSLWSKSNKGPKSTLVKLIVDERLFNAKVFKQTYDVYARILELENKALFDIDEKFQKEFSLFYQIFNSSSYDIISKIEKSKNSIDIIDNIIKDKNFSKPLKLDKKHQGVYVKLISKPKVFKNFIALSDEMKDSVISLSGSKKEEDIISLLESNIIAESMRYNIDDIEFLRNCKRYQVDNYVSELYEWFQYSKGSDSGMIPTLSGQSKNLNWIIPTKDNADLPFIGYATNCCMTLHGVGQRSLLHAMCAINGNAVIVYKDKRIHAQSWLWTEIVDGEPIIVMDSLEVIDRTITDELIQTYLNVANELYENGFSKVYLSQSMPNGGNNSGFLDSYPNMIKDGSAIKHSQLLGYSDAGGILMLLPDTNKSEATEKKKGKKDD